MRGVVNQGSTEGPAPKGPRRDGRASRERECMGTSGGAGDTSHVCRLQHTWRAAAAPVRNNNKMGSSSRGTRRKEERGKESIWREQTAQARPGQHTNTVSLRHGFRAALPRIIPRWRNLLCHMLPWCPPKTGQGCHLLPRLPRGCLGCHHLPRRPSNGWWCHHLSRRPRYSPRCHLFPRRPPDRCLCRG